MQTEAAFQAPIRPQDREAAWGWDERYGQQVADQHVRARLMADDDAVLSQMQGDFAERGYFQSEAFAADRAAGMWS